MTEELLALIYADAETYRRGTFTLAVEKAQEKLKKFQLPDPRYYITQVFQALLAGGADRIEVTIQGEQVQVRFNGPGFTQNELEHIGDAVFESGKNRERDRLRELALGLLSVQALRPKKVLLVSNGYAWTRQDGSRPTLSAVNDTCQRLEIEHRRGDTHEAQILKQSLSCCDADIYLNNAVLTTRESARAASCPWPNYRFAGKNFRGAFGIAYGDIKATSLLLTRYGVAFSRRHEPRIQPPLIVEMEHLGLRKNASQSDVVEDEQYTEMLSEVQKIQLTFSLELSRKRLPSYQAEQVFQYLREVALQHLSQELLELPPEELAPLDRQLIEAPIFLGADSRRYSARDLWLAHSQHGGLLFSDQMRQNADCPPATVLRLTESQAQGLRYLFPRLGPVANLAFASVQRQLAQLSRSRETNVPSRLLSQSVRLGEKRVEIFLSADSLDGHLYLYNPPALPRNLGPTPLHFALHSSDPLNFQGQVPLQFIERFVAPLYEQLMKQGPTPAPRVSQMARQRAILHYLQWKGVTANLLQPPWSRLPLFHTVKNAPVSLCDLQAWLEVYGQVIVTYGPAVNDEDHALQLTPECLRLLRELLGETSLVLAHLAQPYLVERSQQYGLSNASVRGVEKQEVFDEEAELEQIRREIEEASQGGFKLREEAELDEQTVVRQLGLKLAPRGGPELERVQPFAAECLAAVKQLRTQWITRFELPGLEGQLLISPGTPPAPLQPDRLLLKQADADARTIELPAALGLTGWLQVPERWQTPSVLPPLGLRPDSSPAEENQLWPLPAELPALGDERLAVDFVWAARRLFKLAVQNCVQQGVGSSLQADWQRRLLAFLRWDWGWAGSSSDSWFLRVPLLRDLLGQWQSLDHFRSCREELYWAPLGPGTPAHPARTIRLVPPLSPDEVATWLGRPLREAQLVVEEKPEEQLLAEIKQELVETCQRAECPLEPAWIEGLQFGQPTRWLGGPRRYFIEHVGASGQTRLNPADKVFVRLFASRDDWERRVPVLASAVYTAINRELDEVEDAHELAYLEAMLEKL